MGKLFSLQIFKKYERILVQEMRGQEKQIICLQPRKVTKCTQIGKRLWEYCEKMEERRRD